MQAENEKITKRGENSKKKEQLKQEVLNKFKTGKQVEVASSKGNPSLQEIDEAKKTGELLAFHLEKGVVIPGFQVLEIRLEKTGIFMRLALEGIFYNLSCYKDPEFGSKRGNGHLIQEKS